MTSAARRANPADRLLAGYGIAVAALVALAPRAATGLDSEARLGYLALHLGVAATALALARRDRGAATPALGFLHRWFPMLALPWLYSAAGALRHLVVARDLDPWIARWDAALFPGSWYLAGARLPALAIEALHGLYFSYYLLLFLPALLAERRQPTEVGRYLFALTATMLPHYALDFLLPVAGPLAARAGLAAHGLVFVPALDAIYRAFDRGGLAFPSTHVAAALVASWFAARFFPRRRLALAAWFAGIATSTVLCAYHYPIDVLAGLASGLLCLGLALRVSRPGAELRDAAE
ncbi:MAG: phosphatase PAP2 family protein [Thermoanaerobaculia bacterium]